KLEDVIRSKVRLGGYLAGDFSRLSEEKIGSKLYSNMMLLGAAYQKGWIPVSEEHLLEAISESVRKADMEANQRAFQFGRFFATRPELLYPEGKNETLHDV